MSPCHFFFLYRRRRPASTEREQLHELYPHVTSDISNWKLGTIFSNNLGTHLGVLKRFCISTKECLALRAKQSNSSKTCHYSSQVTYSYKLPSLQVKPTCPPSLFLELQCLFFSLPSSIPLHLFPSLSLSPMSQAAKQGGLLAVDCVVICCCCPCMVLQVTLFLFIRLPHKLAVKSKRIILKKLHKRSSKRVDGDINNVVAVVKREENNCFRMEFDNPPERSKPLQSEMQEFPAIHKSGTVLLFGSEEGNDGLDAWIAQDMKMLFDERNTWLGDEKVWREMLEGGFFWFGSFWANGDYLE